MLPASPLSARLLIVEEEPEIRQLLLALLTQEHYTCAAAASIEESLALLEEQSFDLVLAELCAASPRELFRAATRLQFLAEPTPVAIMTSWHVSQEEALSRGFVGLFHKPFDVEALLEWLADLLRRCAFPEAAPIHYNAEMER
jgi:DNA-binding response OmpR family regulator